MTSSSQASLDVQRELMKDLVVHQNVRQELVFTTVDKLKLCLMEHRHHLASRWEWVGPLGLLVSLVTTLVAATFQSVGLEPATWKALYIFASLAAAAWTVYQVIQAIRAIRSGGLNTLVDKITNRQDVSITNDFYEAIGRALAQFAYKPDAPAATELPDAQRDA